MMTDDEVRVGVAIIKMMANVRSPPYELPADSFIEAAVRDIARFEREACAQACDSILAAEAPDDGSYITDLEFGKASGAEECAAAIRAR
jgi:hypothetical protein